MPLRSPQARAKGGRQMHSAGFGACGTITAARVVSLACFESIALNFLRCCLCAHRLPGIALDVESQQVVLGQAEAADGNGIADACMRSVPVVPVEPDRQLGLALS